MSYNLEHHYARTLASLGALTLLATFLAACGSTPSTSAKPLAHKQPKTLTPVTLRLDFTPAGEEIPLVYGVDSGLFKAQGLSVSFTFGTGSAATTELVATGGANFGIGDAVAVAELDAKGEAVKMVMGYIQETPLSVICSAKAGITKPSQLAGKSIGVVAGASSTILLSTYLKGVGLSVNSVKLVDLASTAAEAALFSGQVDCILNYGYLIKPEMAAKGLRTVVFNYSAGGVNPVNLGIVVQDSTIAASPKLVQEFVTASQNSLKRASTHIKTAVADLIVAADGTAPSASVLTQEFKSTFPLYSRPTDKGHPLGWISSSDIQHTIAITVNDLGSPSVSPSTVFTNRFIH